MNIAKTKMNQVYGYITKTIIPILIAFITYNIYNYDIGINLSSWISIDLIPTELRGWILMSIITPLINSIISTRNFTYWFQKCFMYNHMWDSNVNGNNFIEWFSLYLIKHKIYSYDSLTKIINNQNSVWWDDKQTFSSRPQIYEIPSGWILFKYKNKYLLAYFPYPIVESPMHRYDRPEFARTLYVYSFSKINWKIFNEDICNYYYDNTDTTKLTVYRNLETYVDDSTKIYTNLRENASIKVCFGNKSKEDAWNAVLDFYNIENKNYFRKINQTYKTAFLVYGPSGTGKTELLFQIASYTWSKYQKPVYIINPKGLNDTDLNEVFDKIQSGYVLIDEWDLFLDKEGSGKKSNQYPSLNAWLNILDRVSGEIIFWFTSNNYEKLAKYNDGALVRPGRIDHIFKFDKMTADEVKKAWNYFNPKDTSINNFKDEDLNGITIAQIINNLKKRLPIDNLINNSGSNSADNSADNSGNNSDDNSDNNSDNNSNKDKLSTNNDNDNDSDSDSDQSDDGLNITSLSGKIAYKDVSHAIKSAKSYMANSPFS